MFILFPDPSLESAIAPTEEEYLQRVQELIGDPEIPAKIKHVSKWYINEVVAERYSEGNVYVTDEDSSAALPEVRRLTSLLVSA